MKTFTESLLVYPIIDPARIGGRSPLDYAARLIEGGARTLQLRHKHVSSRLFYEDAVDLASFCDERGVRLIINDRLDIALAASAHGVHLGPEDLPVSQARRLAPGLVIGASAGSVEAARQAEEQGADYLGCGAVYDASASKPNSSDPRGPEFIRSIVDSVSIPIVGIGGIRRENASEVVRAGAAGIAVIRATIDQPEASMRGLLEAAWAGRLDH